MNKTNLLVDAGILTAMLIAMEPRFSGVAVHEWLSLSLAAAIVVHLLLHWKWIVGVASRFFAKLWHASRLKFVIDTLLFIDFVAVVTSGILISRVALPALGLTLGQGDMGWRQLHSLSADAVIVLVGLHFALNWDWVVSTVKRIVVAPLTGLFRPRQPLQPLPIPVSTTEPFIKRGE